MKLEYLKSKTEYFPKLLLGIAAIFAIGILFDIAGLLAGGISSGMLVKKSVAQSRPDPNEMTKYFSQSKLLADGLKKNNIFSPPPPKQNPVREVSGILGNEALIGGKWYKAGDSIADAKIIAIEPTQIKILWDGKEQCFSPIGSSSGPPQNNAAQPAPGRQRPPTAARANGNEKPAAAGPTNGADPLAWMGVKLSDRVRAKFLEKWNQMSDSEKEQAKQGWNQMSDEQKQQAADAWEKHL